MIEIIEKKEVPKAEIECSNCGSKLMYENSDLIENYGHNAFYEVYGRLSRFHLTCPVCGCEVKANWIERNIER